MLLSSRLRFLDLARRDLGLLVSLEGTTRHFILIALTVGAVAAFLVSPFSPWEQGVYIWFGAKACAGGPYARRIHPLGRYSQCAVLVAVLATELYFSCVSIRLSRRSESDRRLCSAVWSFLPYLLASFVICQLLQTALAGGLWSYRPVLRWWFPVLPGQRPFGASLLALVGSAYLNARSVLAVHRSFEGSSDRWYTRWFCIGYAVAFLYGYHRFARGILGHPVLASNLPYCYAVYGVVSISAVQFGMLGEVALGVPALFAWARREV